MPGMCLAVVAEVAMSVVGRGSVMATVEETATAAAEEANNGLEIAPLTPIYKSMGKQALS